MSEHIRLRAIDFSDKDPAYQQTTAECVQRLLNEDFQRIGLSEEAAQLHADPYNPEKVEQQRTNIEHPRIAGTRYGEFYVPSTGEVLGMTKVGPWLPGDQRPYGLKSEIQLRAQWARGPERAPQGLHALAVKAGMAKAALQLVQAKFVAPELTLRASVLEEDEELNEAFTALGAEAPTQSRPTKIGGQTVRSFLRELPAQKLS